MVSTTTPIYYGALNSRRLLALFVLLCCIGTTQQVWGQSCDITNIQQPFNIVIDLDTNPTGTNPNDPNTSATGILDEDDVNGIITSSGVTCDVYSFYFGLAQTPVSEVCFLNAADNHSIIFDCDDIDGLSGFGDHDNNSNTPDQACDEPDPDGNITNNRTGFYTFWVSIGDGVNPASESGLVRVNVRLRERTDPMVNCPESFTVAAPDCSGANVNVVVPGFDDDHYLDNCDVVQVQRVVTGPSPAVIDDVCEAHENTYGCATLVPTSNVLDIAQSTESLEVGINEVDFFVVDEHGNEGTCQFTITVAPPAPSVTCTNLHNATLSSSNSNNAVVNASALATDAHDPCGVGIGEYYAIRADAVTGTTPPDPNDPGFALTATFTCADIGQMIEVYIISETSEAAPADRRRSEPCLATVTVTDPYGPSISCPADITIDACGDVATDLLPANAGMPNTANSLGCPGSIMTLPHEDTIDPGSIIGQNCYVIVRKWVVVNTNNDLRDSCFQRITLRDFLDPEFVNFPPNRTVICGNPIPSENIVGMDNCNNDVFIELIDSTSTQNQSLGNCFAHNYQVTRTWQVTDRCGNHTTRSQIVSIRDEQAPVFSSIHPNIELSLTATNNSVPDIDEYGANKALEVDVSTDCMADVTLFPVIDDCADDNFLDIDYVLYDDNNAVVLASSYSPNSGGLTLVNLDQGETYRLDLSAQDPCLNSSTLSIDIIIGSQQPIAACDDDLTVDLNNLGVGQLRAIDVDEGSSDLCNMMAGCSGSISGTAVNPGIEFMRIRRVSAPTVGFTGDCNDFLQAFGCNDINNFVDIELEVTSFAGQVNTCTASVLVRTGAYNGFTTNASITQATSATANDGAITVTINGGVGPYDYAYTGPSSGTVLNQGSPYTISNLGVGTYNITVTDANGCATTINNQTIVADSPVTLSSTCPQAIPNATVNVPINVTDFVDINSVDFTITLNGPSGAVINAVTLNNLPPNTTNSNILAGGQQATFEWFDVTTNGMTLANGTSIATVGIFIPAGGTGTYSLTIDGTQTPVNMTQNQGPGGAASTAITVNFTSPLCTGNIINNPGVVNGDINFFSTAGTGVNGIKVNVVIDGSVASSETTDANGMYSLSGVPSGSDVMLTPVKLHANQPQLLHGVNGGDLVQIQRFLLNLSNSLDGNAPKVIAADANGNNTVDGGDMVRIQRCILGLENSFAVPSWRFIPSTQTFANPNNPWAAPGFAENITVSNVTGTHTANFIGIKVGDTDCSGVGPFPFQSDDNDQQFSSELVDNRSTTFSFLVDDQEVKKGKEFEVTFWAKDFRDILAYQTTIQFETDALSLVDAWSNDNLSNLTEDNFGFSFVDDGAVTTVWYNATEESIEDETALFTLKFKAMEHISSLTNLIRLASTHTEHFALDKKSNIIGFNIEFGQENETYPDIVLYQNTPNPFNAETVIAFDLPEAGQASLSILDLNGKVVFYREGHFNKGYNQVNVHRDELVGQSILMYQVQTAQQTATKKMILID